MTTRRALTWLLPALLGLPGCLDPIVGARCKAGYSPCHGVCVPNATCGTTDGAVASVDSGWLGQADDAGPSSDDPAATLDVGLAEATGTEAETQARSGDASSDMSGVGDTLASPDGLAVTNDVGAGIDATRIDGDETTSVGSIDAEAPLVCAEGQKLCAQQCVDPSSDPQNCGDCDKRCDSGVCNDGMCLVCQADEAVCGRRCAALATDPDNCGHCGNYCMSGLCSNGQCEAAGTGHAIVIGHDYLNIRADMNRVLGNAVFLWRFNPVRVVVYEGDANPTAIAGANAAIDEIAAGMGRQSTRTVTSAEVLPSALAAADVLLIYGQESASDDTLIQLGQAWKSALTVFLQAGGTVVLLDGVYAANAGTAQILSQSSGDGEPSLLGVARDLSATAGVCTVVARGDALATGLPKYYRCELNSTSFALDDPSTTITTVVTTTTRPVVLHKTF